MLKVCVVEDEKSIAELIQINLEIEGYETTLIHNGREAFQKAPEFDDYALIILDVMLPEVSGLDICNLLLRVRILTERSALSRKALQEEIHIGSKVVNFETFIVNDKVTGSTMMLSKKEIELLRLFSEKEGMVVSRDEILDKVWGKDQFPTTRTIDNYILSFRKLFENDPKNPIYLKEHLKQLRYDKAYLRMAESWSNLSHCQRKKVGAIIVKDAMIISDGYNGTPAGFDNCCENEDGDTHWYVLHAEANAILKVAKSTNNCKGATLYLTLSPCKDCSKLVLQAGINRVVFKNSYKDTEGIDFLKNAGVAVLQIESLEEDV